jgi:membrane associated rhomboid family serine protease
LFDTLLDHSAREVLAPYGLTSLEEARLYLLPDQYDEVLRRAHDLVAARVRADSRSPLPSSVFRLQPSKLAPATLCLLVVLAVVFAMESARPGGSESMDVLFAFGATTPDTITSGQLWRLVAATFLHIGLVHLVGNAMALFWLGRMAERLYGPLRFLGLYLLAGLGGSLLTVFAETQVLTAGASGAIWGIMGALLIGSWRNPDRRGRMDGREIRQSIAGAILLNVFVSLTPGVSLTAHLGGFVVGGTLAWAIPFRGGE